MGRITISAKRILLLGVIVCVILPNLPVFCGIDSPSFPVTNLQTYENLIAFESLRGSGHWGIYLMNNDGSNPVLLTDHVSNDYKPNWSPNGSMITFESQRDGSWGIYTIYPDGSNMVRLTKDLHDNKHPVWSPDGSKIAFVSLRGYNWDVFVIDANGGNQINLTNHPDADLYPTWSPDGSKIAFASHRNGTKGLYLMNADGSGPVKITETTDHVSGINWTPDGKQLVFLSEKQGFEIEPMGEIFIVNSDGTNQRNLTETPQFTENSPSLSPDGNKIAYVSDIVNGEFKIFVMNLDGTSITLISYYGHFDSNPRWSPDGSQIIFFSRKDGKGDLYLINADGSNLRNLTNISFSQDRLPSFSPILPYY